MSKPTILTVDDDDTVSQAITRDLRSRYGADYRIVRTSSGGEALEVLAELALRGRVVAMIVSDQKMPQMTGIELLERSRLHCPGAKLLLLTAYADTEVAIRAINEIGLDYYLLKPWDPPEERLYPVIDDLLEDWQHANPSRDSEVRVVGDRWSERSHEIKTFLARNHVPYTWYDIERDPEGVRLLTLARAEKADLPLVMIPEASTLRGPTTLSLAAALGLRTQAEQPLYDLCIVGGGPAGLAAAVYAASEGLSTVIVERQAPGGQAGQSASIENYLGFPKGLSRLGPDPTGGRAGCAVRCRDGAGARGGRARAARAGPGGAARRCRGDRGACRAGGHGCLLPDARGPGPAGAHRFWRLLRGDSQRGRAVRRVTRCTSWERPTRRDRPRSTWPSTPAGS